MPAKPKLPTTLKELRALGQTEEQLQRDIVDYLRLYALEVKQTNLAKAKAFADLGVPDLIISSPAWPRWCWLGMELKTQKGKPSPEQKRLEAADHIVIVRSVDEAMYAIRAFTRGLKLWRDTASGPEIDRLMGEQN